MKPATQALLAAALLLGAAAADLGLRSREALRKARRHEAWAASPELKKAHYETDLAGRRAALGREVASGALSPEEAARRELLLETERDFFESESDRRQAYLWYRDAAETFTSPLNPWAAEAARHLPAALEDWKAELAAAGRDTAPALLR
jgi:hypothetical protein